VSVKSKAQAMSGAGLLVVLTMCLGLLVVIGTASVIALRGDELPEALDRVLQGLLIGVPALLAKTYRDATPAETEAPVPVELVQEVPVVTREVDQLAEVDRGR